MLEIKGLMKLRRAERKAFSVKMGDRSVNLNEVKNEAGA
jgi:hypothetical protein